MQHSLSQKQETIQSAVSYATGGGMVGVSTLVDVANVAQSLGLILGCLVIAVRLVHDAIGLYRKIKNKPDIE